MKEARESLKGNWTVAVLAFFIVFAFSMSLGFIPFVGQILSIILTGPLIRGTSILALNISRAQPIKVNQIFHGFNDFGRSLLSYILMIVFSVLWSLLLIIPGIIASISYSMTFYILADNPLISANDAINMSKKMMYGYKMKLFGLSLIFFLLGILSMLTLGLGFLWLYPYIQVTMAKFYEDIKNNNQTLNSSEPINSTENIVVEPVKL